MTPEEFGQFLRERTDEDYDLMPPPCDAQTGLNILIRHFLGEKWYCMLPVHQEQINTEAISEILMKFPNGEQKKERRKKKISDFLVNIINEIFG